MGGRKMVEFLAFLALWASSSVAEASHVDGLPSIMGYDPEDLKSEERLASLFERWSASHRRVYRHAGERERRFRAFRDNLAYIDRRNRELAGRRGGGGHTVGLNRFADLTNEEFKSIYLRKIRRPAKRSRGGDKRSKRRWQLRSMSDIPSSLDWREKGVVTAVKDQGDCGSCWAFSSTGAIESINAITTGDLISLSEQELIDCDTTNYGCDGGYMDYAFEWVIQNGGIDTEADYSYTSYLGQDGVCNVTKEDTKVVTIDDYEDVAENETDLLYAAVSQPVSVGIDGSAIDFQLYTGGIYDGDCSDNPDDIDHAVLIVGYGSQDDEDYWIVKNSWGVSWGIDGYVYMKRNTGLPYGLCAINAMASYPTKVGSTSPSPYPSPSAPPPPPPPPPSPLQCSDGSYCDSDETCCCISEVASVCAVYGCCPYENGVCCVDSMYCCPEGYPICDVEEGLCFQATGDSYGAILKKHRPAKRRFPWTNYAAKKKEANKPLELVRRGRGRARAAV
ncbi:cysteine protease XCP1-like isoform X1 [Nymphaea colorata]|nr:cysteine protease XCP1-like isoform X1 [Nymphaea colorata]